MLHAIPVFCKIRGRGTGPPPIPPREKGGGQPHPKHPGETQNRHLGQNNLIGAEWGGGRGELPSGPTCRCTHPRYKRNESAAVRARVSFTRWKQRHVHPKKPPNREWSGINIFSPVPGFSVSKKNHCFHIFHTHSTLTLSLPCSVTSCAATVCSYSKILFALLLLSPFCLLLKPPQNLFIFLRLLFDHLGLLQSGGGYQKDPCRPSF